MQQGILCTCSRRPLCTQTGPCISYDIHRHTSSSCHVSQRYKRPGTLRKTTKTPLLNIETFFEGLPRREVQLTSSPSIGSYLALQIAVREQRTCMSLANEAATDEVQGGGWSRIGIRRRAPAGPTLTASRSTAGAISYGYHIIRVRRFSPDDSLFCLCFNIDND